MDELIEAVKALAREEYERAAKKFGGNFNSPHEVYEVILEEVEEAGDEFDCIRGYLAEYWDCVKNNEVGEWPLYIEKSAIQAAAECIQIAAMAYKARR